MEQGLAVANGQVDACLVEYHAGSSAVDQCLRSQLNAGLVVCTGKCLGLRLHVGAHTKLSVIGHLAGNGKLLTELNVLDSLVKGLLNGIVLGILTLTLALEGVKVRLAHYGLRVAVGFLHVEQYVQNGLSLLLLIGFSLNQHLDGMNEFAEHRVILTGCCAVNKVRHCVLPP